MIEHNTYFEGRVQSLGFSRRGFRATVGVLSEGAHHFGTAAAERMTIVSGEVRVKRAGDEAAVTYGMGSVFEIDAKSEFDIEAVGGPAAYLCEYFDAA